MKTLSTCAMLAAAGAALAASLPAAADPQRIVDDAARRQYLFTMSGASGAFADGRLTLDGVPLVVYFADRPTRQAGHMSLADFLALWRADADDLATDPPNAALAIYGEGGDGHAVVVLDQPEAGDGSVSFHVTILDDTIPPSFGEATLFIDAFPCAVNGC